MSMPTMRASGNFLASKYKFGPVAQPTSKTLVRGALGIFFAQAVDDEDEKKI